MIPPVVIAIPMMIVIAAAVIAVPVTVVEPFAVVPRLHPTRAPIGRTCPVSFMPAVTASRRIPVALHPR